MTDRLRISVSGIRGVVPEALNVEVASKFSSAFASYLEEGNIAICRDSRFSSQMLEMAINSSLLAAGLNSSDFGQLPVPFLQFLMKKGKFSGGIAVSGGHNPLPWNAVILLGDRGNYLETSEGSEVFNVYEAGDFKKVSWEGLGKVEEKVFPLQQYLLEISKIIDVEKIRKFGFKVVADPCNGIISSFLEPIADFLSIKLVAINNNPGKPFPHPPEPSVAQASQVEAVVKATGANFGFLLNSDGSRISYVNEKGESLSEEFSFPLCLLSLKNKIKKAVTTLSTSALSDWAARHSGIKLLKTKVGQSAVVNMMVAESAEGGGEGSGSFSLSSFSLGYDAMLSLSLVLDLVAREEKSFSEIVSPFPELYMKKLKIKVPPEKMYKVMDNLEEIYEDENPELSDGVRIDREDLWFNIRPSTTEFILRVIIEGKTKNLVLSVEEEIKERIK